MAAAGWLVPSRWFLSVSSRFDFGGPKTLFPSWTSRSRQQENSADKSSGGLHGVGASVVNFVSEWMEVEVSRDGQVHHMEFERGRKASDLKVIGKASKSGTKVSFKPDPTLFPDINFVHETLAHRLRELAYLNS